MPFVINDNSAAAPGTGKKAAVLQPFSVPVPGSSRRLKPPPSLTPPFNDSLREPKRRRSGAGHLLLPVAEILTESFTEPQNVDTFNTDNQTVALVFLFHPGQKDGKLVHVNRRTQVELQLQKMVETDRRSVQYVRMGLVKP